MVVDSSALLAVVFGEEHAGWAAARMQERAGGLAMSTVSLAEVLIRVRDRWPDGFQAVEERLLSGAIDFVEPDVRQARIAAEARLRWPLNLGDCFAYALAVVLDAPILAVDRDFRATDRELLLPALRSPDFRAGPPPEGRADR